MGTVLFLAVSALAMVIGLCAVLARPTGRRIVRHARHYLDTHPESTDDELRNYLRNRFLGGVESPNNWLDVVEVCYFTTLRIAESVRDYFVPIDRDSVAGKIEAAIRIIREHPY